MFPTLKELILDYAFRFFKNKHEETYIKVEITFILPIGHNLLIQNNDRYLI